MLSVKTASGKKLTIQQLSHAEEAIKKIAANNRQMLEHHYETSPEDLDALCELAHEAWFQRSKRNNL